MRLTFIAFSLYCIALCVACSPDRDQPSGQQAELGAADTTVSSPPATSFSDDIETAIDTTGLVYEDGAILIDWKMLADVTFSDEYNEEVQAYVPYPTFGDKLRAIEGRQVQIEGYIIPLEETGDETILVLSAQPYSSCFFCGGAGPESVMDIKLKEGERRKFITDDRLVFRGQLRLNDSDLYYLNYILEEAELAE